MSLHFPTQSCPRRGAHNGLFGLTENMWNLNCKSVLSATTCPSFIHAGVPASSFPIARESQSVSFSIHMDVSCQQFKHFKHRHDLSLLHSPPHFCTRMLHSAHCSHFKHGHDLSLLLTSALARSTPLTPRTLNNNTTSHCS